MKRLAFILSPFLAACAKPQEAGQAVPFSSITSKTWEPMCWVCGAAYDAVSALNPDDEIVLYVCSRGHVFGTPEEARKP